MPLSMAVRLLLTAVLLLLLPACGKDRAAPAQLRLLAPADLVEDVSGFERASECRVDVRVYDADEDLAAIARRRDVDVIASPVSGRTQADDSVELVRITLERGLEITIPRRFGAAFQRPFRPAGRRLTRWTIRRGGENPACARRWLAYTRRSSK
jgi:hypothetical protein